MAGVQAPAELRKGVPFLLMWRTLSDTPESEGFGRETFISVKKSSIWIQYEILKKYTPIMCGINGFNWADENAIQRMNELTIHRGPDNADVFVDEHVSLGHTRLSIIDLSEKGNQPMSSADGRFIITYNGEVYNYRELRKDLEKKGHTFRTGTDTEVVLASYAEWGTDCLEKFNGMWAFCIYDRKEEILFLARDRIGVKPFFYYFNGKSFIFSSDIKPILMHLGQGVSVNERELYNYLVRKRTLGQSLFNEIKICPPGHYVLFDLREKKLQVVEYYDVIDKIKKDVGVDSLKTCETLLGKSVERRLISDAKVGVVCSGGLDSSLVTALCALRKKDIEVFFVDVKEAGYSELRYVKEVTEKYGLKLNVCTLTKEKFVTHLVDAVYFNEMPLTHPNSIGIYLVSEKAREVGFKVLLTGEGADELFGGYVDRYVHSIMMRKILSPFLKFEKLSRLLSAAFYDSPLKAEDFGGINASLGHEQLKWRLQNKGVTNRATQAMIIDFYDYLQPILLRQDKMSMWASIEARVPFLDYELVEFGVNLPLQYKIRMLTSKYILRKMAKAYLPESVIKRKKCGFAIPVEKWIKPDESLFRKGFLEAYLKLSPEFVMKLAESGGLYWQLLNLELWGRLFVLGEDRKHLNTLLAERDVI